MRSGIPLFIRAFGALALLASGAVHGSSYIASLEASSWRSDSDGTLCHLSHSISDFGIAVFSEDGAGRASLAVHAHRAIAQQVTTAKVLSVAPPWKPKQETPLRDARVHQDDVVLRLGQYGAQRAIRELAAGQIVSVRLESAEALEFGLSPVGFRKALRIHQQCLRGLSGEDTAPALVDPYYLLGYGPRKAGGTGVPALPWEVLSRVYFSTDNAGLDLDAMQRLQVVARLLRGRLAAQTLMIAAYTDPRGSNNHNSVLAQQRAQAVRDYLIDEGVRPDRLIVEVHPAGNASASAPDSMALAAERKVTLRLLGVGRSGTPKSTQSL